MTATMTAPQKIKISSNDRAVNEQKSKIELSLKIVNEVLENYETQEIELNDKEINSLIQGNFSSSTIDRLAQNRYSATPKRQRTILIEEFSEDVLTCNEVFQSAYITISSAVEVRKGKAFIKDGIFEEIENSYTYYISDTKSIELFNRHTNLIKEVNALKEDINAHLNGNINSSYLVHFDGVGDAYRTNISYGE